MQGYHVITVKENVVILRTIEHVPTEINYQKFEIFDQDEFFLGCGFFKLSIKRTTHYVKKIKKIC